MKTVPCAGCPANECNPRKFIPSEDAVDVAKNRVLVLWDAPTENEIIRAGFDFTSPAFRLFARTFKAFAQKKTWELLVHDFSLRCPIEGNPPAKAIAACRGYFYELADAMQPAFVIAVGNTALRLITKQSGITKKCHRTIEIKTPAGNAVNVIPVLSPKAVLRDLNQQKKFEAALHHAVRVIEGTVQSEAGIKTAANINANPPAKLLSLLHKKWALAGTLLSVDVEANTLTPFVGDDWRLLSIGINDGMRSLVLPYDAPGNMEGKRVQRLSEAQAEMLAILADPAIPKVAHHSKFDQHMVAQRFGVAITNVVACTLVMHRVLFAMTGGHDLKTCASELLRIPDYTAPLKQYIGEGNVSRKYADIPYPVLAEYNAMDCYVTRQLYFVLRSLFYKVDKESKQHYEPDTLPVALTPSQALTEIVYPAHAPLYQMERNGFYIDTAYAKNLNATLVSRKEEILARILRDPHVRRRQAALYREINAATANPTVAAKKKAAALFNPNSDKQLIEILFSPEYYGETVVERTAGGSASVAENVLQRLIREGSRAKELCELILEHRAIEKHRGTFVAGLLDRVSADNRVHGSINLFAAATGRCSSSDPNMQNIPRNKTYRRMYAVPSGSILIEADYRQLELCLLAAYSGDDNMIAVFREGRDLHMETALAMYGTANVADISSEMRSTAKPVNFGIAYGMSAFGLAANLTQELGYTVDNETAQQYLDAFYAAYPAVARWQFAVKLFAEKNGCVYTMFGTRRNLGNAKITPQTYEQRSLKEEALRQAVNTPIQGTGGLMTMVAVAELGKRWQDSAAPKMISTVHDSILVETQSAHLRRTLRDLRECMIDAPLRYIRPFLQGVPIEVDFKVGKNWGAMVPFGGKK